MKPLILILSIFCTLSAFGQQPEYPDSGFTNKAEAKNVKIHGKKEGKWIEYQIVNSINKKGKDTVKYMLIVYKHGDIIGMVRQYYKNGKLKQETPFINGKKDGIGKEYYPNGILMSVAHFTNDTVDGVEKTYNKDGILQEETPFKNGKMNGADISYNPDGKTIGFEIIYKDNKELKRIQFHNGLPDFEGDKK